MNCPKCHTPVAPDWALCPKCGILLNQPPIGVGIALAEVKRPSRWHYFTGIAVILITSVIAIGVLFASILSGMIPDTRFVVPGTHTVELSKAGEYIIYYEYESIAGGKIYTRASITDMTIELYQNGSIPVKLTHPTSDLTYHMNGKSGYSVFEFEIDEPGTYTLVADYDEGKSGPDTVIAIGQFDVLGAFIAPFAVGTLGFIIGLIIIIRAAVKRRSIGRRVGVTPVDRFWC